MIKRQTVDKTLFTGNLLVDYVFPLYSGNMNVLTGGPNLGQKQMINNTALNFLNDQTGNNYVIYVTYSKKEAIKMRELITSKNLSKNFVIFTLSENPSDSEYYYLPRIAMNFIDQIIKQNKIAENKISLLFCWDDINTYIFKEKNIFEISKCKASDNIFADIFEKTGNFTSHNLSSLIISEKSKLNREFDNEGEKVLDNIFSFSDKVIKFDCNIAMARSKNILNLLIY